MARKWDGVLLAATYRTARNLRVIELIGGDALKAKVLVRYVSGMR